MRILFISEMLPIDTYASSVVFYRHFLKLKNEGHSIHIITDENSYKNRLKDLPENFQLTCLPNRKWYFPPYKPYGLYQKIRFLIYYKYYLKDIIEKEKIDLLLGYVCGEFLSPFCAYLQKKRKLPLVSFFHDDTLELNSKGNLNSIYHNTYNVLKSSSKVLVASEGFNSNWNIFSNKFHLLFPISTDTAAIKVKNDFSSELAFGYSGTVYNEIIKPLEKVSDILNDMGYNFKIIGDNPKINYLEQRNQNTKCLPLFETAEFANEFLINRCIACIIPYPEDLSEMPWIKTCFPSKLIQYSHLGLPTVIIAPEESALGKWCIKNNWILYCRDYSIENLKTAIDLLNTPQVKKQITLYKEIIFNPKNIHEQFKKILQTVK